MVAELADAVAVCAAEDFGHMVQANWECAFLADPKNAGEEFLGRDSGVIRLFWVETVVAGIAVVVWVGFAEIAEERRATALGTFGVMDHLLELLASDGAFGGRFFIDETELLHDIPCAEQEDAIAGKGIAAGAPGFLVVAFDIFWQIVMDDEADVGFVDAHAKGDGGADYLDIIADESFLISGASITFHSCMVGEGFDAVRAEFGGEMVRGIPALAINNAALGRPLLDEVEQLIVSGGFFQDAIGEVGAIKAADENCGGPKFELGEDVLPDPLSGGGGEGEERHVWKKIAELSELPVFGPEIMSPFTDTMGFVDGNESWGPVFEFLEKERLHQALGSDVMELVFMLIKLPDASGGICG